MYVRSPDGNQVVAMGHGQFVRVNFDNADEMEIQCQRGSSTAYIHVKSGIGELQFTTIYIYTCGTSAESTSA